MLGKQKHPRGAKKRNRDVVLQQQEAEAEAGVSGNTSGSSDDNHSSQAQVRVGGGVRRKHSLAGEEVEMKMKPSPETTLPYPSPREEFRIDKPGTPQNSPLSSFRQKDYPSTPPPAPKKVHPNKNRRRKLKSQGVARMLDFESM